VGVLLLGRWQHPTMYGARCFGLHRKDKLNSFAGKDSISCDGRSRTFGSGDNPESRLHGCPYSFKQLAANGFMWIPRGGFPQMTVCASCGKRVRSWSKRQLPWCGPRGPPPSSSTFRAKPSEEEGPSCWREQDEHVHILLARRNVAPEDDNHAAHEITSLHRSISHPLRFLAADATHPSIALLLLRVCFQLCKQHDPESLRGGILAEPPQRAVL